MNSRLLPSYDSWFNFLWSVLFLKNVKFCCLSCVTYKSVLKHDSSCFLYKLGDQICSCNYPCLPVLLKPNTSITLTFYVSSTLNCFELGSCYLVSCWDPGPFMTGFKIGPKWCFPSVQHGVFPAWNFTLKCPSLHLFLLVKWSLSHEYFPVFTRISFEYIVLFMGVFGTHCLHLSLKFCGLKGIFQ